MFKDIWVEKYRPNTLDKIVLKEKDKEFFNKVKETGALPNHLLFCGPPGIGKTSLAKIIAGDVLDVSYMYINASDERGIDTIRSKVTNFAQTRSIDGNIKIIILDEMDGLTMEAQRALRNTMEEYADNVRFILTANYRNRISEPIMSRTLFFELLPPLDDAIVYCLNVLKEESVKVNGEKDKLLALIKKCYPDLRRTINSLSKCVKNGVLTISDDSADLSFPEELFKKVLKKDEAEIELRQFLIENEVEFGNDYTSLLRSFFDVVYDSSLTNEQKRDIMFIIHDGLKYSGVMDPEINGFCILMKVKTYLFA